MITCPDCGHANIPGTEDCDSCSTPLAQLSAPQPHGDLLKKILTGRIADLKPRKAVTVAADADIAEATRLMRGNNMGCVLVTEAGTIVGILTERDLLFGVAGLKEPAASRVRAIMHSDPVCLKVDDPVNFAFHHMTIGGYRHLPIYLEDGSVGIASARDLLRYLTL